MAKSKIIIYMYLGCQPKNPRCDVKFFVILVLAMAQIAAAGEEVSVLSHSDPDAECARNFECREHDGQFYFNCYYDLKDSKCRCYLGSMSDCRPQLMGHDHDDHSESFSAAASGYFGRPAVQLSLLLAFLAFVAALYFMRTSTSDSVKAAIRYHRLAEHHHEKGEEQMAEHYYRLSEKYRELGEEKRDVVEKD